MRGEIDADHRTSLFLILDSASFKLLKQSRSLTVRLALVVMATLMLQEIYTAFADT